MPGTISSNTYIYLICSNPIRVSIIIPILQMRKIRQSVSSIGLKG